MSELGEILKDRFTIIGQLGGKVAKFLCGCYGVQFEDPEPAVWAFPVGNAEFPPERWYCAAVHSLDGKLNGGYKHSGIDINLDLAPWGDIERTLGLSVYAAADGDVVFTTASWSGCPMVVVLTEHAGAPIWIRYAHIIPIVKRGDHVKAGQVLGTFADWQTGDHLHFDMALDSITTEWLNSHIRWIDPVEVLKLYLDPETVDRMVKKGG